MTDGLTLDDLFQMEMDQLQKEHGKVPDPDSWRWSPFDIRKFDMMLEIAYAYCYKNGPHNSPREISFAEAGSGIGTKLYLVKNKYRMTEYGYEINAGYVEQARNLGVKCEIRDLANMLDQPVWSAFDIVYVARPFKDDLKERQWEQAVQDLMRPGAVYMATFAAIKPYQWTCFHRGPFRGVCVKPEYSPPESPLAEAAVHA